MNGHRHCPHDRGSATVWAAVGVAVIMTVFVVGLHLGAAVIARHRAEAAADLAALAAAGLAVEGAEAACRRAGEVAAAMGATVTSCRLIGWDALVEARVPVAVTVPGIDGADTATGRARAGPVPATGGEPPPSAVGHPGPAPVSARATPSVHGVTRDGLRGSPAVAGPVPPPNAPTGHPPVGAGSGGRARSPTTSGRPARTGGPASPVIARLEAQPVRPTTRRTTGTLVVTPVPISDPLWKRRDPTRLLDAVTGRARPADPGTRSPDCGGAGPS